MRATRKLRGAWSADDSGHRRRRFHRRQLCSRLARRQRRADHQSRQADLRGQSRQPGLAQGRPSSPVRPRRHRGSRAGPPAFSSTRPRAVVNFAAESHVDRSIHGPADFIATNVVGTFVLLDTVRAYWGSLAGAERADFRFVQISTDEVYGSLEPGAPPFSETNSYAPTAPIPHRKRRRTIWCAPTITPMGCRR